MPTSKDILLSLNTNTKTQIENLMPSPEKLRIQPIIPEFNLPEKVLKIEENFLTKYKFCGGASSVGIFNKELSVRLNKQSEPARVKSMALT